MGATSISPVWAASYRSGTALGRILRLGEAVAKRPLAEHLGEFGQQLQVLIGGLLGHQQDKDL